MGELILKRTINNLFIYSDKKEWKKLTEIFTEKVFVDFYSVNGIEADFMRLEELVDYWNSFFSRFDSTHHQIGNILIDIYTESSAHTSCYITASYFKSGRADGEILKLYGEYDFHLVKVAGYWKIDKIIFQVKFSEGNINFIKHEFEKLNN